MRNETRITTYSIINNPVPFFWNRASNKDEVFRNALSKTTMDMFLGRFSIMFGDNPTASAVFRDALKIPTAYSLNGTEIGGTGIYHDEGGIYSALAKASCKGTILVGYIANPSAQEYVKQYVTEYVTLKIRIHKPTEIQEKIDQAIEQAAFELIARGGNYVCEIPARFFNIESREKQLIERHSPNATKEDFFTFVKGHAKLSLIIEATGEASAKTFVADLVGEGIKWSGYAGFIRDVAMHVDNAIAFYVGGDMSFIFEPKDDIWTKGYKSAAMFTFNPYDVRIAITFGATLIVDWSSKVLIELINSPVFTSSTRGIQDLVGIMSRDVIEAYSSLHEDYAVPVYEQYIQPILVYIGATDNNITEGEL
jgi:hypothetical protein